MEEDIRKKAILRYIVGKEEPKAIYTSLNRTKPWFFKWLKRYQTGDTDWCEDRSRAPLRRPKQTRKGEKELIVSTRKRLESEPFAQTGVSAIKWELTKLGATFPSDSTINRILKREGFAKKNFLCSQGYRVSLLYGAAGAEQHPPGGSARSPVH
jgi:putative transposase